MALLIVLGSEQNIGLGKRTRVPIFCAAIRGMIVAKLHKGAGIQLQLQSDIARLDDPRFLLTFKQNDSVCLSIKIGLKSIM